MSVAEPYKRDFWIKENQKHIPAHYRLQKSARIINAIAGRQERDLLDVGCGPATLMRLVRPNIHYHGIDIAIHDPAPNLIETDIIKSPISFDGKRFDIVAALGLFEYVGACQDEKFGEIAKLLGDHGRFVLTYTNFGHRDKHVFEAFSNVQPFDDFRRGLARHFTIDKYFPTSYNWHGGQPVRSLLKAANMHVKANVPLVGSRLAVEYFFICSPRLGPRAPGPGIRRGSFAAACINPGPPKILCSVMSTNDQRRDPTPQDPTRSRPRRGDHA